MTNLLVCAVANLFRVYLISRFMHLFFDEREGAGRGDKIRHVLAYGSLFLVDTASNLVFHAMWLNIACNLLGIGLIVLTYTRSFQMILFVACSICLMNAGCEMLAVMPFMNDKDDMGFNQVHKVVQLFLLLICEVLSEKILGTRHKAGNVRSLSLGLMPLCSLGTLCAVIYTESGTQTGLVIVSTGLVLVIILSFCLYNVLSDAFSHQQENEMLRKAAQGYSHQLAVMLQGEEKVKALRHDMKHHLNELKILAARNENRAIEKYIDDMTDFIANPDEIVSLGNVEVDSVLNYMLSKARRELRAVNVDVHLPKRMEHSFDLNVILGNLLENGMEAARQTEEKRLDVSIELQQGVLQVRVENSCHGKLEKKRQKTVTTKKGKGFHGIGLENVRKTVEKHNGSMKVCHENDTFRVVLILYVSEIRDVSL